MTTLELLYNFATARPGFDGADYGGDQSAYRADYAVSYKGLQVFRDLYRICGRYEYLPVFQEALNNALTDGGRLELIDGALHYTAGQYKPTEYRWAAVNVLRKALFATFRAEVGQEGNPVYSTGDEIRRACAAGCYTSVARKYVLSI